MGTVRFGNDHFAAITDYGDYVQGNITVCHVYYVEGLRHNLFNVGQFCDGDLEVTFRSNTCYVRNLEGDDLLTGANESNLYTISISDMTASSPVYLLSKATLTKSWLWHRRLSHLKFGTINDLTKHDLVDGLPNSNTVKIICVLHMSGEKARNLLIHLNCNYGVICEDMLKGAYIGAKTKIIEDCSFLTNTPYPEKRYGVSALTLHKKMRTNNSQYGVSLFCHMPYPAG
ncbi:integrase, catalytic region, zinc finger, CCHC-type containing protein [Tanacetum coccineum]